ncbi:hypothetical protein FS749_002411 [Ceratobasidium sp. UAMH 11750]|nr:hypothetical protein FS749_002411 [Ceratobasidium sp. UAMH 11750]
MKWGIVGAYKKAQARIESGLKGETIAEDEEVNSDTSPHFEVRAFSPRIPGFEDPVTGSLNAGFGKWLVSTGLAPQRYIASHGTCLGRSGRVYVSADKELAQMGEVWVGGETSVYIKGEVFL